METPHIYHSRKPRLNKKPKRISHSCRLISRQPRRSAPIPRLQSIKPQTRPSVAPRHSLARHAALIIWAHELVSLNIQQLQAQVYMTNNRTKQQPPPPAWNSVFEKSIGGKIYSTYETDGPFMLQLQVRVQVRSPCIPLAGFSRCSVWFGSRWPNWGEKLLGKSVANTENMWEQ